MLRSPHRMLLALAVIGSLAYVVWTGLVLPEQPPLPGRELADPLTGLLSLLGDFTGRIAGLVTLGGLAGLLLAGSPAPATGEPEDPKARRLRRVVGRAAQVWLAAGIFQSFANAAFVNAVPIGLVSPAWWTFVAATPSALAWTCAAVAGLVAASVAYLARHVAAYALAWVIGAIAYAFIAVTGNVTVGLNHDWATDAAVVNTIAMTLLASGAVGTLALGSRPAAERRQQRWLPALLVPAALAEGVVTWQALAGNSAFEGLFGVSVVGTFACLVLLGAGWAWRLARGRLSPAFDVAVLVAYSGFLTTTEHVPPPRFLLAQNAQINYLGYEMNVPDTIARLLGLGRPNLLWLLLSVGAVLAYAWGMLLVRRCGGRWPVTRLLAWVAGWGLTCYLAVSGLWEYSTAVFSWHMLVHMTVNMLVPILCVLGGPFSLIEAASRRGEPGASPGLREVLTALGDYRPLQWLLSPAVVWAVYVGSLFAVYFTDAFAWLMRYHWAHQLMLLHFMVAGYAFFSLVIGVDKTAWRMPPLVRFALVLSIMPFHAIFAVGIMMAREVIGESFYRSIDVAWNADLMATQNVAGQITWFTGEVPMFVAVIALAAQWFRQDNREAATMDSLADSGVDDSLDAYNALLAQLAEHDQATPTAENREPDGAR